MLSGLFPSILVETSLIISSSRLRISSSFSADLDVVLNMAFLLANCLESSSLMHENKKKLLGFTKLFMPSRMVSIVSSTDPVTSSVSAVSSACLAASAFSSSFAASSSSSFSCSSLLSFIASSISSLVSAMRLSKYSSSSSVSFSFAALASERSSASVLLTVSASASSASISLLKLISGRAASVSAI